MAKDGPSDRQTNLTANLCSDHGVIAGDDLHVDAACLEGRDRRASGLFRRIEEGQEAMQNQRLLIS